MPFEALAERAVCDYVHLWDADDDDAEIRDAFCDYIVELDELAIFVPCDAPAP